MFNKIIRQNNNSKAFTLVEALVAISILMIAIASPMTLAQKGLSTATLSKDQMVASFLAQDAIEAVKNIRDQVAISANGGMGGDWLTSTVLSPCMCTSDTECNFDLLPPNLKFCTIDTTSAAWNSDSIKLGDAGNTGKLKITYNSLLDADGTYHFMKYDYNLSSVNSKFTRYVNIRKSSSNLDEAIVNVRVFWDSPLGAQKIDLQNFIYNYSENL